MKPNHVAIIMDGNGRWAKQSHLPRIFGHTFGVNAASNIIAASIKHGIKQLTLFALSTENMQRPLAEVNFILKLFERMLLREVQSFIAQNVKFRFIGERKDLPIKLQDLMNLSEEKSSDNNGLIVTIAVNYSGRWQIANAAQELASKVEAKQLSAKDISEDVFNKQINDLTISDPDLLIRTGSEQRISNFMLWSLAYTEIYFSNSYWPDFNQQEFASALDFFQQKNRRYGLIERAEYE